MFKNYLVTALRNLYRNKLFSVINIGGLAIGLAATILILLFVRDEFSWDSWVPESERIYRVELLSHPEGRESFLLAPSFGPLEPFYEDQLPEVETSTRLRYGRRTVSYEGNYFEESISFVDSDFIDVFALEFLAGNAETALKEPSSIIISENKARKYFGQIEVLGETLTLDNGRDYRITGVFKDIPLNSHFKLDLVFPMTLAEFPLDPTGYSELDDWFSLGTYVYLKLKDPELATSVRQKFPKILDEFGPRPSDQIVPSERWNLLLTNLQDIHLEGAPLGRIKPKGSKTAVFIFLAVALLVLIIACFNFINLSTARAALRAREVGVRKVFGASKPQLLVQFYGEVLIVTIMALMVALALVEIALPWYNNFLQKILGLDLFGDPLTLAGVAGLLLIVILGAGSHPAFTISSFKPIEVLKSGPGKTGRNPKMRTFLVGAQFAIAISLMISSLVIYSQVQFGLERDQGYAKENILVLDKIAADKVRPRVEDFKNRLLSFAGVKNVTIVSAVPAESERALVGYGEVNGEPTEPIILNLLSVDESFFETFEIPLIVGRNFDRARSSDISKIQGQPYKDGAIIVSESALSKLGFTDPNEAIGATLNDENLSTIIGVAKDVHLTSTRSDVEPLIYMIDEDYFQQMAIKLDPANTTETLNSIGRLWAEMFPETPISQGFLTDLIQAQYQADLSRGYLFAVFAGLAIIIAVLGLYGMSAFSIAEKTKEIGIKKVMGASSPRIISELLWQFSKPVLLANLIAWPVTWYFMADWLTGFVYRIDLTVLPFLLAAAVSLLIGWGSVAGHAFLVSRAKPIHALRYE